MGNILEPVSSPSVQARASDRKRLIVLGMHRSGASALARVLRNLGFYFGDDGELTSASSDDPGGVLERRDIRTICDRLLNEAGADWWKVSPIDIDSLSRSASAQSQADLGAVVSGLDDHRIWAIKDPRLCLLLPVVLPAIRDAVAVIVVRHPAEVAQSLRRTRGLPTYVGLALWEAYLCAAFRNTAGLPRLIVNYHDLVGSPEKAVEGLAEGLEQLGFSGLSVRGAAEAIDPGLYREQVDAAVSDQLSAAQRMIWESIVDSTPTTPVDGPTICSPGSISVLRQYESDELARREGVATALAGVNEADDQGDTRQQVFAYLNEKLARRERRIRSLKRRNYRLQGRLDRKLRRIDYLEEKISRTWRRRLVRFIPAMSGSIRDAIRHFKLGGGSRSLGKLIDKADKKLRRKRWSEVIEIWQDSLSADHTPPVRAFCDTSQAHRMLGDLATAGTLVDEGLAIYPGHPDLIAEQARIAFSRGDWDIAREYFREAIDAGGKRTPEAVFIDAAKCCRACGDVASAEEVMAIGIKYYPASRSMALALAAIAMDQNNWSEAEARWRSVLDGNPDWVAPGRVYREFSKSLRAQGQLDQAAAVLRRGIEHHPADAGLVAELDQLSLTEGQWRDAVVQWRQTYGLELGLPDASEETDDLSPVMNADKKIVVYTCLYGDYETLKAPLVKDPRVRWVVFTDSDKLTSSSWEVVVVDEKLSSLRRTSRLPKMLPHIYLGDHDISIYIDSSIEIKTPDILLSAELMLEGKDIALYRHHSRDCIYEEIEFCDRYRVERHEICEWYKDYYLRLGVARHSGLFENTLIVRRNTPQIRRLNETWWSIFKDIGGQRDQHCFPAALHLAGVSPNPIQQGYQVRKNPYVNFYKHNRQPIPEVSPKVLTFIAYAPEEYGRDLGRTYNDYMSRLDDDDVAVFLDHDAMLCGDDWAAAIETMVRNRGQASEAYFIGRCNRIGNPYQRLNILPDHHDLSDHALAADVVAREYRDSLVDVTRMPSSSGVVMVVPKKTWTAKKFKSGFLKVDNNFHKSIVKKGGRILLMEGLYVYHFYRADGDASHAVREIESPEAKKASDKNHFLRNMIYSDRDGIDLDTCLKVVKDREWLFLSDSRSMFCSKSWYHDACRLLKGAEQDLLLVANTNEIDADAPETADVLAHRDYAATLGDRTPATPLDDRSVTVTNLAISRSMIERIATLKDDKVLTIGDLFKAACRLGGVPTLANRIYACVNTRDADAGSPDPADAKRRKVRAALGARKNVALFTLGFWPQQAGMEMFIHNLAVAMTKSGDLVTLFAPSPKESFEEITRNYIVRRFNDEDHLFDLFDRHHQAFPFDAIIVQGAYEAASIAMRLKAQFDVPVILRTHGEDIQVDREIGYGYRLDPAKAGVIETNIRAADYNVAIARHVRAETLTVAPDADVAVIGNGIDVGRFDGKPTALLRERFSLGEDTIVLLTVGRNVKKKSLRYAVEALAELRRRGHDVVLVHAGKDGNAEPLPDVANALGVGEHFHQLGESSYFEMPQVYASADIFVFPSRVETFGNVTLEAMASGLPCVEFNYLANEDKIADQETGYIVDYGDLQALVERLEMLVTDEALRKRIGEAARIAVARDFDWPMVAGRYREVVDRVSRAHPTRRRLVSQIAPVDFRPD